MANGNKLYSAYKGAGKASSSYKASLYDVANIGSKRESSAALSQIKAEDKNRMVGMISEGLDLAGNVIRKGQRRKEMKTASDALGAKAKDRSLWGKLTGEEQMYEKIGEDGEMGTVSGSDIMAEYKLSQAEKAFGRTTSTDEKTGKVKSVPSLKKPPTVPELETEKPESLADEVVTNLESENTSLLNVTDSSESKPFYDSTESAKPFYERYSKPKQKKDRAEIRPMPGIMNY